jgi:hypothetical protein
MLARMMVLWLVYNTSLCSLYSQDAQDAARPKEKEDAKSDDQRIALRKLPSVRLLDEEEVKMIFNTLKPKKNVHFYSLKYGYGLLVKEGGVYYQLYRADKLGIKDFRRTITRFMEPVKNNQQAKDLVNFIMDGRIIISKEFFERYCDEVRKFMPNMVADKDLSFWEFTSIKINDNLYKVNLTKMLMHGIYKSEYLVNANGDIKLNKEIECVKKIAPEMNNPLTCTSHEMRLFEIEAQSVDYVKKLQSKHKSDCPVFHFYRIIPLRKMEDWPP